MLFPHYCPSKAIRTTSSYSLLLKMWFKWKTLLTKDMFFSLLIQYMWYVIDYMWHTFDDWCIYTQSTLSETQVSSSSVVEHLYSYWKVGGSIPSMVFFWQYEITSYNFVVIETEGFKIDTARTYHGLSLEHVKVCYLYHKAFS